MKHLKYKITGGIPYTAHGAQITPPPLFLLFFVFMLILGQVRFALQGSENGYDRIAGAKMS